MSATTRIVSHALEKNDHPFLCASLIIIPSVLLYDEFPAKNLMNSFYVRTPPAYDLLEKVGAVVEAKERHRVGEHPDVAAATIIIRLRPFSVLVAN